MSVVIKEVKNRCQLRQFVLFTEKLYKDNPYYVPQFVFDQMDTLDQKKGAAQEFCDSKLYLAYKDGKLVGRVAAIVNNLANQQWDHKEVRFGWYDFVDDPEVSKALMDKVEEFGRERHMDSIVGPLGFTDFDPEGLLIEGYDQLSTMALIYNHPYYVKHIDDMGFQKDADWIEYKVYIPEELPDKFARVSKIIQARSNVHLKKLTRKIIKKENYGKKIFDVISECYKKLYNYTVLPEHMADKYLGFYLSILDLDYITVVENDKNEIVAFGVAMPSLADALQKSRGKFFPFGWYYIIKDLFFNKHNEGIELLLIGVHPDHQNTGVNSLIFADMFEKMHAKGVKWAETNAILETNTKNQAQFQYFDKECKKRRRSYIKPIEY